MPKLKLAIIGIGLIGGSLGLALKIRLKDDVYITACARTAETMRRAVERGACDMATADIAAVVGDADVVFLSTPVLQMVPMVKKILPHLRPGTILTDAGSTKGFLFDRLKELLPPDIYYVAGHPMTGKEKSGIEAASPDLFVNHCYVVVKDTGAPAAAVEKVCAIARTVGANLTTLDISKHDRCASLISHMPHIAAAALVTLLDRYPDDLEESLKLAAGGFKDTTRIASSNADMWSDILLTNPVAITDHLEMLKRIIDGVETAIANRDRQALHDFFAAAKSRRDDIIETTEKLFEL